MYNTNRIIDTNFTINYIHDTIIKFLDYNELIKIWLVCKDIAYSWSIPKSVGLIQISKIPPRILNCMNYQWFNQSSQMSISCLNNCTIYNNIVLLFKLLKNKK